MQRLHDIMIKLGGRIIIMLMHTEIARWVVLGNVDAGKTSLVSVLAKKILDDGKGSARNAIVKLHHERQTGRTSSHAHHYMLTDAGEIVTIIDLCGHERYLKTTLFGVMGLFAPYAMLVVGANMGLTGMAMEHLGLLLSLKIPFIILVTKCDICPENIMAALMTKLQKIANNHRRQYQVYGSDSWQAADITAKFMLGHTDVLPVICVSNKTGANIEALRDFLSQVKCDVERLSCGLIYPKASIQTPPRPENLALAYLDAIYHVNGVGLVLSGVITQGVFSVGENVYLGPVNNRYVAIYVKSMHNCIRESVSQLSQGMAGTFAIRLLEDKANFSRHAFTKGQILTNQATYARSNTCYQFDCDIVVFRHSTTITNGYQCIMHCGTICQTVVFTLDENVVLRTGSRARVKVRFMWNAEFILPIQLVVFRDGKTKGMGLICQTYSMPEDENHATNNIKKQNPRLK